MTTNIEEICENIYNNTLKPYQKDIVDRCIKMKKCGLKLKMGSGKTIISLISTLKLSEYKNPILIIVQKNLVSTWQTEIKKFFGDNLKYIYLSKSESEENLKDNIVYIATPQLLLNYYKSLIKHQFLVEKDLNISFNIQGVPFSADQGIFSVVEHFLYSTKFSSLIIDEVHKFTKIDSLQCQSICCLYSENRFLLSGTIFDEPIPERILGYYMMLGDRTFPNNINDTVKYIQEKTFKGVCSTLIECNNEDTETILYSKFIEEHDLYPIEKEIYGAFKKIITDLGFINSEITIEEYDQDLDDPKKVDSKRINSYILAIITYIRQCIICPMIPLTNILLNKNNILSQTIINNISNIQGINQFLDSENAYISSRMERVLNIIEKHKNEKIVLFSCFRTFLDILTLYINEKLSIYMKILSIKSDMNVDKRSKIISEFNNSESSTILLLTYELGAEGLNLQTANILLLVDFWWNIGKTKQAISRIIRPGQISKNINIYYFTSNTGIEKSLFLKQQDKLIISNEIHEGPINGEIRTLKMKDILNLINKEENTKYIDEIEKF